MYKVIDAAEAAKRTAEAEQKHAEKMWDEMKPAFFKRVADWTESRNWGLYIDSDDKMNQQSILSYDPIRIYIIEELQKLSFEVNWDTSKKQLQVSWEHLKGVVI